VSSGNAHTCGVKSDDTIECWGNNVDGQRTPPSGSFESVSSGTAYTCGVKSDDTVACWGNNVYGQSTPPSTRFKSVSSGQSHTCGIKSDDSIVCWGARAHGLTSAPPDADGDGVSDPDDSCPNTPAGQTPNGVGCSSSQINDAPAGTNNSVTTNEDSAYPFTVTDFGFSDSNDSPANSLAAVKITTLPSSGTLKKDGTAVIAGNLVTAAEISSGKLTFEPAANVNGSPYTTFTFQVKDDGGTANGGTDLDQSANTLTVNVTSVNDAPAGTNNSVTTNEDTPYTFTIGDFGFTDTDPGDVLTAVRITTLPGIGILKNDGAAVSANDIISAAAITSGKLTFEPAPDGNGSPYSSFGFKVKDASDFDPSANAMTINVIAVSDGPQCSDALDNDDDGLLDAEDPGCQSPTDNDEVNGPIPALCASAPPDVNVIVGTGGDDDLVGTSGVDYICGGGGNDTIHGRGGDDVIAGNSGNDSLYGSGGEDVLTGNGGDDALAGGRGQDQISGGRGRDTLFGLGGPDSLSGGGGNDNLRGGDGRDHCNGGTGRNTFQSCESTTES
jgi:Ca2+-binding RTX toxin-like protein